MASSLLVQTILQALASHIILSICLGILTTLLSTVWFVERFGMDKQEPPRAPSKIPIIGHLIGIRKHDIRYLEVLR